MLQLYKRYLLTFGLLLLTLILATILWLPGPADSVTPEDICPKHNISTGEYTACFYCHNAETPEEAGFTVNSDSQFCLSCHDGTMDISMYLSPGSIAERISRPTPIGHIKGIDHPFSVSYTEAKNLSPTLKLKSLPLKEPMKLFNEKVECASCHDPHSCANPFFLRIKTDRSGLCLACHDM